LIWLSRQAFAEALKVNTCIENMNLVQNGIGEEGAKAWRLLASVAACGTVPIFSMSEYFGETQ
jgi:hypothetical protein